jgi:multiple sugar transport system permease protein
VTLPILSPTLIFNHVMGINGAFKVFTSAFVLFGGGAGPEDAALFYSFYLYRKAFEQFQIGYGSALAWILFLIILGCTLLVFRSSSLWVYYEGQKEEAR